ncbi:hypothetical protein UFOVP274_41 [uncultured Caudovirales phage]|uniref:Uncharacterized protein n=1 Tax=uncultured Caudovirales phage TaxID=2100421 RepID=A0A6J5LNW5_9CAUD|nr:hypothetical protein UFOVP274_41 [uncultured Caudovirales phage]
MGWLNHWVDEIVSTGKDIFGAAKEIATPLAPLITMAVAPQLGAYLAAELGVSAAAGNALANAAIGVANGQDPVTAIESAAAGAAGSAAGSAIADEIRAAGASPDMTRALSSVGKSLASTAARGGTSQDYMAGVTGALINAGINTTGAGTEALSKTDPSLGELGINTALNPDGTMNFANNADGSATATDSSGNKTIINPDGTTKTIPGIGSLISGLLGKSGIDSSSALIGALGASGLAALTKNGSSGSDQPAQQAPANPTKFSWGEQAVEAPVNGIAYGQQFVKPTYAADGGLMSIGLPPNQPTMFESQQITTPTQQPVNGFLYDTQPSAMPNYSQTYAKGGLSSLGDYTHMAGGRFLKGPGDGMSDDIPATIADKQPARLANEEFVIPADVVSHLGNGSSEAGAKVLYKMMEKVRHARTGTTKQGKQINPEKFMPNMKA